MHCEQAEMLIPQYIFNELSTEDSALVAAHLTSCESCSKSCKELKDASTFLEAALKSNSEKKFSSEKRDQLLTAFSELAPVVPPIELMAEKKKFTKKTGAGSRSYIGLVAIFFLTIAMMSFLMPTLNIVKEKANKSRVRSAYNDTSPIVERDTPEIEEGEPKVAYERVDLKNSEGTRYEYSQGGEDKKLAKEAKVVAKSGLDYTISKILENGKKSEQSKLSRDDQIQIEEQMEMKESEYPSITSITTVTPDGSYKAGEEISVKVNFSESITLKGPLPISLENGRTVQIDNYTGVDNTKPSSEVKNGQSNRNRRWGEKLNNAPRSPERQKDINEKFNSDGNFGAQSLGEVDLKDEALSIRNFYDVKVDLDGYETGNKYSDFEVVNARSTSNDVNTKIDVFADRDQPLSKANNKNSADRDKESIKGTQKELNEEVADHNETEYEVVLNEQVQKLAEGKNKAPSSVHGISLGNTRYAAANSIKSDAALSFTNGEDLSSTNGTEEGISDSPQVGSGLMGNIGGGGGGDQNSAGAKKREMLRKKMREEQYEKESNLDSGGVPAYGKKDSLKSSGNKSSPKIEDKLQKRKEENKGFEKANEDDALNKLERIAEKISVAEKENKIHGAIKRLDQTKQAEGKNEELQRSKVESWPIRNYDESIIPADIPVEDLRTTDQLNKLRNELKNNLNAQVKQEVSESLDKLEGPSGAQEFLVIEESLEQKIMEPETTVATVVPVPVKEEVEEEVVPQPLKKMIINPFVKTSGDALSTFSIDTDSASYYVCRQSLLSGNIPNESVVRPEEFINAFDYNYGLTGQKTFAISTECMKNPLNPNLYVLKVGIKGKVLGRDGRKPVHVVLVVDTSGSMAKETRLPLVKKGIEKLVTNMQAGDHISLVTYGTDVTLNLDYTPIENIDLIQKVVESLRTGGSTDLAKGVLVGYQIAANHFKKGAMNQVMICSDGVANVGHLEADNIIKKVENFKKQGISFTSIGFGSGDYNDHLLEKLALRGDGFYYYVNSDEDVNRVFENEIGASFSVIAKDAKLQVRFKENRVLRYRLIGYESREVKDKDFRNNAVDGGEIISGKSVTAIYELELAQAESAQVFRESLGTVTVRYQNIENNNWEEDAVSITGKLQEVLSPKESPYFYLGFCAATFAEIMRKSPYVKQESMVQIESFVKKISEELVLNDQVKDLLKTVQAYEKLRAKE